MRKIKEIIESFKQEEGPEVYDELPSIIRVLLSTDGTVTEILEAWYNCNIEVDKLAPIGIDVDSTARCVMLRNSNNGVALLYASSRFNKNFLSKEQYNKLMFSDKTIGEEIDTMFGSTNRKIRTIKFVQHNTEDYSLVAQFLGSYSNDLYIYRTYDICSDDNVIVEITEVYNVRQYM